MIDAIASGKLKDVKISFVLSDKKDAYILKRARKNDISSVFLEPKGKSREDYDKEIDALLEKDDVELILLIGYMKLMSPWFVKRWINRVMNIHPSLLPMFAGGMDKGIHEAVLEYGCKVTGCSLIFIDEGADTGPVILQEAVEIDEGETADSLKEKVQKAEQETLIKGIGLFRDKRLKVKGRLVHILER